MSNNIINSNWQNLYNNQEVFHSEREENENLIESYFFIYDCIKNDILFINNYFNVLTGYDDKTFTIDQLIMMIHPEDQPYFFQCEERGLNFTNTLQFNQHYQYLLSYSYRIITKDGRILTLQQQCQAIEVNGYGHLSKTLVLHKVIDNYTERPLNDYKIFDKSNNIFIDNENCYNLTPRELEILNLIKEGKDTAQMSEELHLSKHTISTHRKNILKKTNSGSFIELIRKVSFLD